MMGEAPGYRQGVLLERCRVLEEGGCASVCLNVCKVPTQNFFNEIGLDVELRPDYETFECRFVYGKKPPEMNEDPAFDTPCFAQCPISKMNGVETGSVEGGKNAGMNLPRWAMDGDGGGEDLRRLRRSTARRPRAGRRMVAAPTATGCRSSLGTPGGTTAVGRVGTTRVERARHDRTD